MKFFATCLGALLFGLCFATNALAAIVSVEPITGWEFVISNNGNDVDITGSTAWAPNAPPILKIFNTNRVAGLVTLHEKIHNAGNVAWTDWDEQLMVPDGTGGWVVSNDFDNLFWNGATVIDPPGATVTIDEPIDLMVIDFSPPVPPSSVIVIDKQIQVPQGMQTFAVAEFPTVPEPSSVLLLLGSGLVGVLGFRRRYRR